MERENHSVWSVYDKLRTACLNVKYFSRRLAALERQNFLIEITLLATAPSSAVAGLWFWNTEYGWMIWQYLGIISAIAAILKPSLQLTKKIKDFESVLSGYRTLEYDLREIKTLIEQSKKYDKRLQLEFQKALHREKILVGKTPETKENKKLIEICEQEVRSAFPGKSFFIPTEE
jgi:hypothetical protein